MNKEFFKTKNGRIVIWIAIIIIVALFLWLTAFRPALKTQPGVNGNNTLEPSANSNTAADANKPKDVAPAKNPAAPKVAGYVEKKAPHFVSATIANGATLTQAPSNLTLTFDTALLKNTQAAITVKKDDITSVTLTSSSINDKTMTVRLNAEVTDGDYSVYYVACFADTGCKDGRFGYHLKLP
jgi:methionine-rich copper-binding protein CopC